MIAPHEIETRCVGKTVVEATKLLAEIGYSTRVVAKPGFFLAHELFDRTRMNVSVKDGLIDKWAIG